MKHLHISILLPIHNGLDYTQKCLENIQDSFNHPKVSRENFTVVIIDDGSTDGSAQWIETHYPETVILKGDGTLWWSGGINKGIEYALNQQITTHILMWNNDISIKSDYLHNLHDVLSQYPTNTLIGSKIYFADNPSKIWVMGGVFNRKTGKKYIHGTFQTDSPEYNIPFEADWLTGMGTAVHRDVFEKIGLMDAKNFPQYHGDSDFTLRANLAGYKLVVLPQLCIWNDKSNSGMQHLNSFQILIRSLYDIKSNNHIGKDILFYRKYSTSLYAYKALLDKYLFYIGGFFKWKIMNIFGAKKQ